jgi:hypothetical protein
MTRDFGRSSLLNFILSGGDGVKFGAKISMSKMYDAKSNI